MEKLLFIYNPTAGKGQATAHLSPVIDVFTKKGWLVTVYPTQGKGDATQAAQKLGVHFDRVVCAGGDGTLSETVTGLLALDAPPPLGYIPFGSTNDCAATLSLPKDPREAAAIAARPGPGTTQRYWAAEWDPFVYVAAFGAFTQVAYGTPQDLKNTLGHLAYVLQGIASLPTITPYHLRVEYDGRVIEDDFFGMVSNALSVGGIKTLKPDQVVLDDGLFEVTLVRKPVSLADVANGFQSLVSQTPVGGPSALVRFQASHLVFTGDQPIPWTIDGEYGGTQPVNVVSNCRRALDMIRGN